MSHITHTNESCTYEWDASHMSVSHVTHVSESCRTCEWVMSHVWMSHGTHTNESCYTYEWVMSHMWVSHGTRMSESCLIMPRLRLIHLWHAQLFATPTRRVKLQIFLWTSHMRDSCLWHMWHVTYDLYMSHHVTHDSSCHIWLMLSHMTHILSHMTHPQDLFLSEWVMSQVWMSHVTYDSHPVTYDSHPVTYTSYLLHHVARMTHPFVACTALCNTHAAISRPLKFIGLFCKRAL